MIERDLPPVVRGASDNATKKVEPKPFDGGLEVICIILVLIILMSMNT